VVAVSLLVAEPGASGTHDLERIIQMLEHFEIPSLICINKYDLSEEGTRKIHNLAKSKNIPVVGEIPFNKSVPEAIVNAVPITQFRPRSSASQAIKALWEEVKIILFEE
jgi:MinD superfamily P-loop ATPase